MGWLKIKDPGVSPAWRVKFCLFIHNFYAASRVKPPQKPKFCRAGILVGERNLFQRAPHEAEGFPPTSSRFLRFPSRNSPFDVGLGGVLGSIPGSNGRADLQGETKWLKTVIVVFWDELGAQILPVLSLCVMLGREILRMRRDLVSVGSRFAFPWIHRHLEHLDKL